MLKNKLKKLCGLIILSSFVLLMIIFPLKNLSALSLWCSLNPLTSNGEYEYYVYEMVSLNPKITLTEENCKTVSREIHFRFANGEVAFESIVQTASFCVLHNLVNNLEAATTPENVLFDEINIPYLLGYHANFDLINSLMVNINSDNQTITVIFMSDEDGNNNNNNGVTTVPSGNNNDPNSELPVTGGAGTLIFSIIGLFLINIGMIMVIYLERKKLDEKV